MKEDVERVLGALEGAKRPFRIVIDGPSGSGKTTFAELLAQSADATVLHLDDMYEGWQGMAAGTRIAEGLLSGADASFRRWDWASRSREDEVTPDPSANWIIEGCGATTPVTAAAADLVVWVNADPEVAKKRGLERDGEVFEQWWDVWHAQEQDHWDQHNPRELSDLVIET